MTRCGCVAVGLLLLCSSWTEAGIISGRVLDSRGRPFASVTIEVVAIDDDAKRLTGAAMADGAFRLQVPSDWPPSEIHVSAVGAMRGRPEEIVTGDDDVDIGLLVLPAGHLRQGVVRDESGQPVAGARVSAISAEGRADLQPGVATTDAFGQYVMTEAPERVVQMTVRHPGYVPRAAPGTRTSWVLKRGGAIQGVVLDERGRPAGNARVTASDQVERTDAHGMFTVSGLAPGLSHLVVSDDRSHVAIRDVLVVDRQTVATTLSLGPGVVVNGIIRDSTTGRPLPFVRVRVYQGSSFTVNLQSDAAATSDAAGRFLVVGLSAGQYVFEAHRFGFLRAVQMHVLAPGVRPYDVGMLLTRESRIEGRVIDAGGQPVPGAYVVVKESNAVQELARQLRAGRRDAASTYADRDGRFVLKRLWPGRALRIEASGDGFAPARIDGVDLPVAAVRSGLTLTLHRGVIASGVVSDEQDRPLADVAVYCTRVEEVAGMGASSAMGRAPSAATTTDREGRYVLSNLDPGRYFLTFALPGYSRGLIPATAVVAGTLNELPTVALRPSVRIQGRVVDEQQQVLSGAQVFAIDQYLEVVATTSDENGDFEIANLNPGDEVSLRVESDGMAPRQLKVLAPATGVMVRLSAAAMLRGRVIEADTRKPIADFSVERLVRVPGTTTFRIGPSSARLFHSDEGAFELSRVPPGPCLLRVRAPGYQTTEVAVPNVPPTDEIVVAVSRGARLTGRVVLVGVRQPVPNVTITWRQGDASRAELEALFASLATGEDTTVTDSDGRFVLEGLPSGSMTLFANHAEYAPARMNLSVPARSNVEMTIGSGGTISGVVVLAQGGTAGGATVAVAAAGERMGMAPSDTATADSNGRFRFGHLRQGSYTLIARSATGASRPQSVAIAGDEQHNDIVLTLEGGTTIRGLVRGLPREALMNVFIMAHGESYYDSTQTNADGAFVLPHVPPGVVGLEATTSFHQGVTAVKRVDIPENSAGVPGAIDVDIDFAGQSSVLGVVMRRGRPIGAIQIAAVPSVPSVTTRGRGESQDDGTYRIDGLQDGRYQLIVTGPSGVYQRATDVRGSTRADIDLPSGSLSGNVIDAESDQALGGATVTAVSGRERTPADVKRTATDSTGRYAFSDLDPGTYQVRVTKSGYRQEVRAIAVQQNEERADFGVHASRGLTVRVVDGRTGAPLARATIRIAGSGGLIFAETVTLDDGGRGEIPSLGPGRYVLSVHVADYAPRSIVIQLPAVTIDVVMDAGGRVQLRSRPESATRVRLIDSSGIVQSVPGSDMAGWVDVVGPITAWPHVAPGAYKLESMTGASTTIVVTSGATSMVDLR